MLGRKIRQSKGQKMEVGRRSAILYRVINGYFLAERTVKQRSE